MNHRTTSIKSSYPCKLWSKVMTWLQKVIILLRSSRFLRSVNDLDRINRYQATHQSHSCLDAWNPQIVTKFSRSIPAVRVCIVTQMSRDPWVSRNIQTIVSRQMENQLNLIWYRFNNAIVLTLLILNKIVIKYDYNKSKTFKINK